MLKGLLGLCNSVFAILYAAFLFIKGAIKVKLIIATPYKL